MAEGLELPEGANKRVALLISVLALFLALGETLGKNAQTEALGANVEASNLWSFYQAKTIRGTVIETAAEQAILGTSTTPDEVKKQVEDWLKTVTRYASEPSTGEGRKELSAKATAAEERRDLALSRYHHYELGSAAFQIGIVLASAEVITGVAALVWAGGALGLVGTTLLLIGLFAPHSVHLA